MNTVARVLIPAAVAAGLALAATPAAANPVPAPLPAPAPAAGSPVENSLVHVSMEWTGNIYLPNRAGGWKLLPGGPITAMSGCTGFFVSTQGHLATAGHCVDPAGAGAKLVQKVLTNALRSGAFTQQQYARLASDAIRNWRVTGVDGSAEPARTVRVVQPGYVANRVLTEPVPAQVLGFKTSREGDVSLLKVDRTGTTPLPLATADPAPQTPVTSIGFPAVIAARSDAPNQRASFLGGTVASLQTSPDGVPQIEVTARIGKGMSGGPTVNAQGEVIGINSRSLALDAGQYTFVTDTTDTRGWLAGWGAPLTETAAAGAATAAPAEADGLQDILAADDLAAPAGRSSLLWPAVVAALVLAVAAGALLLLLRRRPRAATPSGNAAEMPICSGCGDRHFPGTAFCTRTAIGPRQS